MGSVLSFFRAKKDAKTLLDKIQDELEDIEEFRYKSSANEKHCICLAITLFVFVYLTLWITFLVFWWSSLTGWRIFLDTKFLASVLVLIVSIIAFYLMKKLFHSWYVYRRDNKEQRHRELIKQRRKILERVKETETYRDAEEILRRYDPNSLRRDVQPSHSLPNSPQRVTSSATQLRYRNNITPAPPLRALMPALTPQTNVRPQQTSYGSIRGPAMTPLRPVMMNPMMTPTPIRTVKPILPQNRTVVDKLVDYMVSDGPNNRYALICIHCYSHNGMALKEEFEFIPYKCCYCHGFNPPRKIRPQPPRLNPTDPGKRSSLTPLIDEPESDTDSERGRSSVASRPNITEISEPSDGDKKNTVNNEKSDESVKTEEKESDKSKSVVETETTDDISDTIGEDKRQKTSRQSLEEKDIPFIDDSNL